jgi:hypothetical protein
MQHHSAFEKKKSRVVLFHIIFDLLISKIFGVEAGLVERVILVQQSTLHA